MASNAFKVNVYEINGIPQKNIYQIGFPDSGACLFLNYTGNNPLCNAYVQTLSNQYQYSVAETVAALVTLANT